MPSPATRADALRLTISSVELDYLDHLGTIAGVKILRVSATNGVGTGRLRGQGDGSLLSWRAPGSALFGTPVEAGSDGTYLLEDGVDHNKWVRVQVFASYLVAAGAEASVALHRWFDTGLADDDVTAAEATAGDVATYQATMENDSGDTLFAIKCWIDAAVVDLEISDDGAAWVSPTTEAAALSFPDLVAGGTDILHLRRTIGSAATFDPDVINDLHFSFVTW